MGEGEDKSWQKGSVDVVGGEIGKIFLKVNDASLTEGFFVLQILLGPNKVVTSFVESKRLKHQSYRAYFLRKRLHEC